MGKSCRPSGENRKIVYFDGFFGRPCIWMELAHVWIAHGRESIYKMRFSIIYLCQFEHIRQVNVRFISPHAVKCETNPNSDPT